MRSNWSKIDVVRRKAATTAKMAPVGRPPLYHTVAERKVAAKTARQKYYYKRKASRQRLASLVKLSAQTALDDTPELKTARAILLKARALLVQLEPTATLDLLVAASKAVEATGAVKDQ